MLYKNSSKLIILALYLLFSHYNPCWSSKNDDIQIQVLDEKIPLNQGGKIVPTTTSPSSEINIYENVEGTCLDEALRISIGFWKIVGWGCDTLAFAGGVAISGAEALSLSEYVPQIAMGVTIAAGVKFIADYSINKRLDSLMRLHKREH